jgi:hypothetical protein
MNQCDVGATIESIAVDVAAMYPKRLNGNQHLLVAMDYFMKCRDA